MGPVQRRAGIRAWVGVGLLSAGVFGAAAVGVGQGAQPPAQGADQQAQQPAQQQPATGAAAAPTPSPSPATTPQTHVVAKGTLSMTIQASGVFQPVDPVEVRLRPEAYKGGYKVVSAAPNGADVKAGDVVLEFEADDINRELAAARNDLAAARATMNRARADAELAVKGDALAMQMQEEAVENAKSDLKWFDDVLGPQMLKSADLDVQQYKDYVGDQEDELDQLKKMYEGEDLTSLTADIVIKRAIRSLERTKIALQMQEELTVKTKTYDHAVSRKRVAHAVELAEQALASLQVAQEQAKVLRETGLAAAAMALDAAERRVADLEADAAQFKFAAPADGRVYYGQLTEGGWQGSDPRMLKAGESVMPGPALITIIPAGAKLQVTFDVPESRVAWVSPDVKAKVTSVAFPELSFEGACSFVSPVGRSGMGSPEQVFPLAVQLEKADPRIVPGMRANVTVAGAQAAEPALLVPASAVSNGKVKVRSKDGMEQERPVELGRTDGQSYEVRSGLQEGEEVVLQPQVKP